MNMSVYGCVTMHVCVYVKNGGCNLLLVLPPGVRSASKRKATGGLTGGDTVVTMFIRKVPNTPTEQGTYRLVCSVAI